MGPVAASITESKRALREQMSARRRAVSADEADRAGRAAAGTLLGCARVLEAPRLGLYASLAGEVPTRPLFDAVRSRGAAAFLPRVMPDRRLRFTRVDSWSQLDGGAFGVLEPAEDAEAAEFGRDDVVVVPGVAFDAAGRRLGRGGGYYDRTFPPGVADAPTLIGLAFEFQVVDCVPHEAHDRRVDAVVTEHTLRDCAGERC